MWTIPVPYTLMLGMRKPRRVSLNLNVYRNADFHTLNNLKVIFEEEIRGTLNKLPKLGQVKLTYTLFPVNKGLVDVANVCSIVDKFFCDALVNSGRIEDDNYNVVLSVLYRFGKVDPTYPRVEVTVEPVGECLPDITQEEEIMQITLVQSEIETAIRDYIHGQINIKEGMRIDIDLSATRGADGFKAAIDIVPDAAPVKVTAAADTSADKAVAQTSNTGKATAKPLNIKAVVDTAKVGAEKAQEQAKDESKASTETSGATAEKSASAAAGDASGENQAEQAGEAKEATDTKKVDGEQTADEAQAAAQPRKSLFAGLNKPVNG